MSDELPAPLTPPDCDLRMFAYMELDVQRLLRSEWWLRALAEQPEACGAAVNLWAASWHEVPAASVPASDFVLWKLSQLDRPVWDAVKKRVLEPWVKCSDGRLYHQVVAEKALEAMQKRRAASEAGRKGNARRWGSQPDRNPIAPRSQSDRQPVAGESGGDPNPIAQSRAERSGTETNGAEQSRAEQTAAREGFDLKSDPALIVIQAFDQALVDVWGPERRRPFPVGSDIVYARRWFAAGYKSDDLYRFFLARQQARKAKDKDPIGSLAFLANAVAELGGASTAPAAAGQAQVRFLSLEAELRARKDWFNRDLAAHKATGAPMGEVGAYGMAWDRDANQFRLAAGDRPPIPPAAPREATG